jgi:hypothetical protein
MSIVRHLLIQSVDRISGTTDDFTVKIPPLMSVGQVSLLSASIPNTIQHHIVKQHNLLDPGRSSLHDPFGWGIFRD